MLKDTWTDKQDGVDIASAEDINSVANAVVDLEISSSEYERKEPVLTNLQTSAQLGEELISSSGWTSDGWTGDLINGFTHTTGNTTALSFNLSNVIAPTGKWFQVSFACNKAIDTTSLQIRVGNSPLFELYGQIMVDKPAGFGIYAIDDSPLEFIPTSTFDGKIYNISIKEITGISKPIKIVYDEADNVAFEMRLSKNDANGEALVPQKNIFIGANAGSRNTTGSENIAVGSDALKDNTSGFWNVGIGTDTLKANSVGSRNIAIGRIALSDNTTGHRNVAIGSFALNHNTEGHHNVAIGSDCLDNNTTGYNNVGIGFANLYRLTTGYENTAIGYQAGTSMSTGFQNIAIGGQCLRNATWAQLNTAMGYNALYAITGGSWNIGIGANAGKTPTSAKRCTFIGYNTDGTKSDAQNSTAIGNGAIVSKDNQVVIGNDSVAETVLKGNVIIRDTDGTEHEVNSLFAQMGDISTALDSIIALQNSYIGGASV